MSSNCRARRKSCVAHRVYGATQWVQGNYLGARDHLEQAVALSNPERDRELAFPFGTDIGVNARTYLALALWPLGKKVDGRVPRPKKQSRSPRKPSML